MEARLLSHRIDQPKDASSYMDHHKAPYQRLELNSVKHKELQDKLLNSTRSRRIWKTDRVFPVKPIPMKTCSVIQNKFAGYFEPHPHLYSRFGSLNSAPQVINLDCIDEVHLSCIKTYEVSKGVSHCNLVSNSNLSDCSDVEKLSKLVSCSDVLRQKNCSVEYRNIEEKLHESDKSEKRFIPEQQEVRLIGIHTTENTSTNCSSKIDRSIAQNHQEDVETSDKPYRCNVCDKRFRRSHHLREHSRIHTGEKPYQCNVCNKSFRQSSEFSKHSRIHTGEKPYQCNVCNKRFHRSDHLRQHSLIHTNEKPYQCNVCNKRFRQASDLRKHSMIHTDEKPYECNVCNKRFRNVRALKYHNRFHSVKTSS